MKHKPGSTEVFAYVRILVFLCTLCFLCGKSSAQNFKQLHPGVEHAQVVHKIGTDPVKINLLRLDTSLVRLDVELGMDSVVGLEKISSIATRHGAVAAINSGFFRLDSSIFAGDPAGILVLDGDLLSESLNDRVALSIENRKDTSLVEIGRYRTLSTLKTQGGANIKIDGFNRERKSNEVVIYTPHFGRSTLTDYTGKEFVVLGSVGHSEGRLVEARVGSSILNGAQFIVSTNGNSSQKLMGVATKNRFANWSIDTRIERLDEKSEKISIRELDMVGGVPQLIKNGKIDITWEQEKAAKAFAENRHPRTAVAKLKDGKFLMVTVDGRQPGVSVGMNLQELAEYLLSLGATDAMNLDGGGSTTMFLDGKVVNTPSDKEGERKIGDAILVTLRNKK